jgi:hypothetical protein
VLCVVIVPGTDNLHAANQTTHASYEVAHAQRIVERGSLTLTRGHLMRRQFGKLPRGRYTLIIATNQGGHRRVLLRRNFTVN